MGQNKCLGNHEPTSWNTVSRVQAFQGKRQGNKVQQVQQQSREAVGGLGGSWQPGTFGKWALFSPQKKRLTGHLQFPTTWRMVHRNRLCSKNCTEVTSTSCKMKHSDYRQGKRSLPNDSANTLKHSVQNRAEFLPLGVYKLQLKTLHNLTESRSALNRNVTWGWLLKVPQ